MIHCRDCHQEKEPYKAELVILTDLCDDCWKARERLLAARKAGTITQAEFAYAQHGEPRRRRIAKVLKEE